MKVLLLKDILESGNEDWALDLDHVVSEGKFSIDDRLLDVLDFVDLDRKSVIGFCDLYAQLLGRYFGPIKVGRAAIFALVELQLLETVSTPFTMENLPSSPLGLHQVSMEAGSQRLLDHRLTSRCNSPAHSCR